MQPDMKYAWVIRIAGLTGGTSTRILKGTCTTADSRHVSKERLLYGG